jgi:hypothetical protein
MLHASCAAISRRFDPSPQDIGMAPPPVMRFAEFSTLTEIAG